MKSVLVVVYVAAVGCSTTHQVTDWELDDHFSGDKVFTKLPSDAQVMNGVAEGGEHYVRFYSGSCQQDYLCPVDNACITKMAKRDPLDPEKRNSPHVCYVLARCERVRPAPLGNDGFVFVDREGGVETSFGLR